ncbi:site-specific DNA-methyltransferase [Mesorhizobium sp. BH1-1-5]|uniref:DNA-methyltransferase n=1 Tax=Mesorhizobium sp. BH1-1-5 TaxID=2876661 RepID=UPI001CCD1F47|nr:site-specific DNA-methyltransferase [Mesorhizobium sp. BH1-1-5]MBZ9985692.1 site-specific DNA-methyltransferase [Mesorhizobium sp. BH1-1-5]
MSARILQGDCRDVLAEFADESFDCIVTDPPYGETSLAWDKWPDGWPAAARRVLKRTGSMWVFGSIRMFLDNIGEFAGWRLAQDIVWEKHNGSGLHADRFKRVHECAAQFYRDDAAWARVYKAPQFTSDATARTVRRKGRPPHMGEIGDSAYRSEDGGPRLMRSVIYARSEHGRAEHPTQKPIEIVEPLLLYACPIGGTVLDCFAGSGTTGVVARRHGIDAVLIEADPKYTSIAASRIENDAPLLSRVSA